MKRSAVLVAFGARVRAIRARHRLTQEQLAAGTGFSVAYISLLERGGRNPPLTTMAVVAKTLGVPVGELL